MKYLIISFLLGTVGCATAPTQQIAKEQPKMLQCKILCQGGDTYAFNLADLNCQCKKPVKSEAHYHGLPDPGNGVIAVMPNGKFIMSKVKK